MSPFSDQTLFDEINTLRARLRDYEIQEKKHKKRVHDLMSTIRGLDKQNKWYRSNFGDYQGERRTA